MHTVDYQGTIEDPPDSAVEGETALQKLRTKHDHSENLTCQVAKKQGQLSEPFCGVDIPHRQCPQALPIRE